MIKFYAIIVCLLLFGCKHTSNNEIISEGSIVIDININENSVLKYSDIFDSIRFIRLETQDSSLVGRIKKIIAIEDKFVVLDASIAKMVFVFDSNGKFLNRIGAIGGGTEEYDCPDDISYDKYNDEILVWCYNKQSILKFKIDGTFSKRIQTAWWASAMSIMNRNAYLLYLNNISQKKGYNNYQIAIINEDGKISGQLLQQSENIKHLSSIGLFSSYNDEVLFTQEYRNEILTIDNDEIKIKYYSNFHEHNIPLSALENVTSKKLTQIIMDRGYAFNSNCLETSSHVILQFVYKRMIFDCYYSKETKTSKISSIYVNDIYALCPNKMFMFINDDSLISFVEPQSFIEFNDIVKFLNKDRNNIKDLLIRKFANLEFTSNSLRRNYIDAIKSSNIKITDKEIDFINSVDDQDNPIIWVAKLKKF
jgi:hypothetical protein